MRVLFLTQGSTLTLFSDLADTWAGEEKITPFFYVTDSEYYERFIAARPNFEQGNVLKEWDVLSRAAARSVAPAEVERAEAAYGDPTLWNLVVADRRLFLGKHGVMESSPDSRYSHDQLQAIVVEAVDSWERFLDAAKPDLVVSFICVTQGEYLAHKICQTKNIPFLNLRPTRIQNYFHAATDVFEPSARQGRSYGALVASGLPEPLREQAAKILAVVRGEHAMYEGVIPASGQLSVGKRHSALKKIQQLPATFRKWRSYRSAPRLHDNHFRGHWYPWYLRNFKIPLRKRWIAWRLRNRYSTLQAALKTPFVLFPLHKEPEVTLLVYSREWLNQLEAIRLLARSIPIGMKLVVKEHPAGYGYHPLSFYEELLRIPNLILVPPNVSSRPLVQGSALVAVISGSIGLEALMLGKPVIALGGTPFSWLPKQMFRHVEKPSCLAEEISGLLRDYRLDDNFLLAYIGSVINTSAPVDFYSTLIGRQGVFAPRNSTSRRSEQLKVLAAYLRASYRELFAQKS